MPTIRHIVVQLMLLCALAAVPASAEDSDLAKAIRIGSGPTVVVEYTDPDCPYCRKAADYFRTRSDVTLYVYLKPLASHPRAREKSLYILSSPDPARAYAEVMAGSLDNAPALPGTPAGERLLREHQAIAQREKIVSTPTFVISGRIIRGFDLKQIKAMLPR